MGLPKRKKSKYSKSSRAIMLHMKERGLVWSSSNGVKKSIAIMDSNHIKNCLNKIERGEFPDDRNKYISVFKMELIYRSLFDQ